jgi:glucose dehydrogenase
LGQFRKGVLRLPQQTGSPGDDRQFVVVAAGGNAFAGTDLSDAVVAYALAR